MGEISVHAQRLEVLTKSLRPLPVTKETDGHVYNEVTDKEFRYRQRYVDLIINPHAIPSRMTIGQLMELLAGKLASTKGEFIRATAFEGVSADEIKDGLHELGFQRYGREVMYDGRTGEKKVFVEQ